MRIGNGFDIHQLVEGRPLVLGGIKIEHYKGLLGHSDGDALTHAIINALLGAACLGDIGIYFPSSDDIYHQIVSLKLLQKVKLILEQEQYQIVNIDSMIICQNPKLSPFYLEMRQNIASVLDLEINQVSIKSTTADHIGPIGQELAIACQVVCLLNKKH